MVAKDLVEAKRSAGKSIMFGKHGRFDLSRLAPNGRKANVST
jgi:hypothetical protein